MATLNIHRIAARYGHSGDYLQSLLADPRYTQAQVAAIMGTSPQAFAKALTEPALYRNPRNWTFGVAPGTLMPYAGEFFGRVAQVYSGPAEPGLTWGAPLYDDDTPQPVPSRND